MPGRISRRSMADYIATGLIEGQSKKKLLNQLAGYLVETRRTKEIDLIVRDIEFQLSQHGIMQASIISAFDLATETKLALESFVKETTKASQVSLTHVVDPTVLGGVKITIPGYELDQTVRHQLTLLKTRFKKA